MGQILKAIDVKLEGQFQLPIGKTASRPANKGNLTSAAPKAHIVENTPEFAVIEITCSCGIKTSVKCQYSNTKPVT